jgi:hypothetical protein
MPPAASLREDYSAAAFRALRGGRRTLIRADVCCPWLPSGTGWIAARRRRSAAWTDRRCATGCIGPEGLIDNWTEGPKPRLSAEQLTALAVTVEAGPS